MPQRTKSKEGYLKEADRFLGEFGNLRNQIRSEKTVSLLNELMDALKDLRIVQEGYDSGEEVIPLLYDRYLPYLLEILESYVKMESSGNYDALVRLEKQLNGTLKLLTGAVKHTTAILPRDEAEEAEAEKKAMEMKRKLDEISKK